MQELLFPDPCMILCVGASASGKSTFTQKHFLPTQVLSSDRMRAMICDDPANQKVSAETFLMLRKLAGLRMQQQRIVVVQ